MGQVIRVKAPRPKPHRPRRSACADASLQAEIERVRRMTIEERMVAALTMRDRHEWVRQITKEDGE